MFTDYCVPNYYLPKKWTEFLSSDVYQRLADCKSLKSDIVKLAQAKLAFEKNSHQNYGAEDALVYILELFDCNSIDCDLTKEEYESILSSIV